MGPCREEANPLLSETLANSLGQAVKWSPVALGMPSTAWMPVPGREVATRGRLDPDSPQPPCRHFQQAFQQTRTEFTPRSQSNPETPQPVVVRRPWVFWPCWWGCSLDPSG